MSEFYSILSHQDFKPQIDFLNSQIEELSPTYTLEIGVKHIHFKLANFLYLKILFEKDLRTSITITDVAKFNSHFNDSLNISDLELVLSKLLYRYDIIDLIDDKMYKLTESAHGQLIRCSSPSEKMVSFINVLIEDANLQLPRSMEFAKKINDEKNQSELLAEQLTQVRDHNAEKDFRVIKEVLKYLISFLSGLLIAYLSKRC